MGFSASTPRSGPEGWRNAPAEPRERDTPAGERERLAQDYAPDVARLAQIAPEVDPALWPSVRELL